MMKNNIVLRKPFYTLTVMCTALTLTFSQGCGTTKKDTSKATNIKVAEATTVPTSPTPTYTNKPVTWDDPPPTADLYWYFCGNGPQRDVEKIEERITNFVFSELYAHIHLICYDYSTYNEKVQAKLASGTDIDICFTSSWTNNFEQNVKKGSFTDLNPWLEYIPETRKLLGEKIKSASMDGKIYAIPTIKDLAHNCSLFLREDLVMKYHFDTSKIKKLEDLEPMLQIIKEKEPGVYPLEAAPDQSPYKILDFEKIVDNDCPGAIYGDGRDTKVVNDLDTPEAKNFYALMHKYYKAGFIRKDSNTLQDWTSDERLGKIFAHLKTGSPLKKDELFSNQGVKWVQIALTEPVTINHDVTTSMHAVPASSRNAGKALYFLEMMNTYKYLNSLINFGIEGQHYVMKGFNTIDFQEDTEGGKKSGYYPNTPWQFGNQYLQYVFTNEDPNKWNILKEFNEKSKPSPLLGFTFNPKPVEKEIDALKKIKKQFFPLLETGRGDPSIILPKMNQEFIDAGIDKVLKEMQLQVDQFNRMQENI